jgi:carbonic anhydrase/acetyltransferase-like protein (isoleucine patch superfamily)
MLYPYQQVNPTVSPSAWVAPSASVIGKVILAAKSSVWFGAVLRGDNEPITVGEESNIQENCVLHTDPGKPLTIGQRTTIGHMVTLHGCQIGADCLIGIGAIVLNGAQIGDFSLVGAGALVTENKIFPERSLILGSPAKWVRTLSDEEIAKVQKNAQVYVKKTESFMKESY